MGKTVLVPVVIPVTSSAPSACSPALPPVSVRRGSPVLARTAAVYRPSSGPLAVDGEPPVHLRGEPVSEGVRGQRPVLQSRARACRLMGAKRPSDSVLVQASQVSSMTVPLKMWLQPSGAGGKLPGHGAGVPNQGEHFGVGVCHQIAAVQGASVDGAAEVPAVGLRLAVGVAAELRDGAREQVAPSQGRPRQDAPQLPRNRDAVADHLGVAWWRWAGKYLESLCVRV